MINYPSVETIKELPQEFIGKGEVKGFHFQQIKASEYACIYRVSPNNHLTWYEVFKKKINRRWGTTAYPKAKAFGISAWTSTTEAKALERFAAINEAEIKKGANKLPLPLPTL